MRLAPLCRLLAVAALVVLACAEPALAVDKPGEAKGGLDFTGIKRYDLGIYTLVVFALLLFIVMKLAWPKISAGLAKREQSIRGALDEAKRERAEATELLAKAKKEVDEAAGKVKAMLDEARRDADALKAAEREAGAREAQAERERAKRDTAGERDAALKDVQQQAVELAVLIATKALRQKVSIEAQEALVNESIAELKAGASRA
jgi:F-type H+-transporting ATPase subunit b